MTATPPTWQWTSHARHRCTEMAVQHARVEAVLDEPALDYPSPTHPGRRIACGSQLAVVYHKDDRMVITVLWHGREGRQERLAG